MKRLFVLLLVLVNVLSVIPIAADSGQMVRMTLEQAQAKALATNVQYRLQDSNINDSIDDYADTEENNDKLNDQAAKGFFNYFTKPINMDLSLQTAANKVAVNRSKKDDIKRNSDYNVLKAFIGIKKAQYELEDAKNTSYIKSKNYEVAKVKQQLGYITDNELKKVELDYKSAVINETSALKGLQESIQTLNRYIGRELTDYNIQPVIDLSMIDMSTINLDEIREQYIKNKPELYTLSMNAKLAQKRYDLTKERYDEFVVRLKVKNSLEEMEDAFDQATRGEEDARNTFEDALKSLDISLNSTYNSIVTTVDSINNLNNSIETAKAELEKAKITCDLGLMSKNAYEEAELNFKALQNKLNSSIADLNLLYSGLTLYCDSDKK